jgi:pyrimidine operon attenuation protein/uracil phosphoribosyltransferase
MKRQRRILSAEDMTRTIERLAFEIIERHDQGCGLALIGIQRRGVELAQRVKKVLEGRLGCDILSGKLDINLYRDDWTHSNVQPHIGETFIPFDINDKKIVLVDDVLFSGRTIRAALEAILDYGGRARWSFWSLSTGDTGNCPSGRLRGQEGPDRPGRARGRAPGRTRRRGQRLSGAVRSRPRHSRTRVEKTGT